MSITPWQKTIIKTGVLKLAKGSKKEIIKGILKENPVFRLVLGTCPALAVTTSAISALGMGAAATVVLICSNFVISACRKIIPDKVRIPAYITIIAGFVSVVQLLVKAFAPALDQSLGIYLPLITVNCIILGRAEAFAGKNAIFPSILDGLGMGIGFTASLFAMGCIREFFGAGTLFGFPITNMFMDPIIIFILPPGGFFVYGLLVAVVNKLTKDKKVQAGCSSLDGCGACPMGSSCSKSVQEEGDNCANG